MPPKILEILMSYRRGLPPYSSLSRAQRKQLTMEEYGRDLKESEKYRKESAKVLHLFGRVQMRL
ncbi:hypothetical protein AUJ65_02870 [Candidatus Micrarchaeota archaeon CG1_02_51_15]|nr:MAG: hypothetical protein AUJ65_02870 [Candidatus Micrarchaeota archaeon CG1_02_51_15]